MTPIEPPPFGISASAVALGEQRRSDSRRFGRGQVQPRLGAGRRLEAGGDFARLVGDDRVLVRIRSGRALLSPHRAISGLAEWRGIGLLEQDYEDCAVLALIVDLESEKQHAGRPRLPEPDELCSDFHGLHDVPLLRLPAKETERRGGGNYGIFAQSFDKVTPNAHFTCQVGRKHENGPSEIRRFRGRLKRFRDAARAGTLTVRFSARRPAFSGTRRGRGQDGKCR